MIGLLVFLGLWIAAWLLNWSARVAWAIGLGWYLVILLLSAPLFGNAPLAPAVGGDFRFWLISGPVVAAVIGYRHLLRRIRAHAPQSSQVAAMPEGAAGTLGADPATLTPPEVERYARHILLREIGGPGQQSLRKAKVLVIGAGGLGAPVLMYLAGAGVGVIGVIDGDVVDTSNLQRQIIHTSDRIGMPKVFSAEMAMKAINPFVEIRPYHRRLDEEVAAALIADYDLVLDGTDNFDTRYLVNRVCAALGKPLIAAAITQWEGQLSLYDPAHGGACFECVFPTRPAPGLVPTCAEAGVAAPLPGVIGSMMAMEAVKHLTGAGQSLLGRLMIHDALYAETRTIAVRRREDCAACGGH